MIDEEMSDKERRARMQVIADMTHIVTKGVEAQLREMESAFDVQIAMSVLHSIIEALTQKSEEILSEMEKDGVTVISAIYGNEEMEDLK